jgi:hypothetical protein
VPCPAQEERRAELGLEALIWRLTADCVRCSSSAAARKLSSRATASKARIGPTANGRWRALSITLYSCSYASINDSDVIDPAL